MNNKLNEHPVDSKATGQYSAVKAVISWLIQADQEYRAAQSMVDKTQTELR
ncbi:MAG: hypothetical protein ABJ360_14830 [Roseobacter sp.]